jgi:hypothetical protein
MTKEKIEFELEILTVLQKKEDSEKIFLEKLTTETLLRMVDFIRENHELTVKNPTFPPEILERIEFETKYYDEHGKSFKNEIKD